MSPAALRGERDTRSQRERQRGAQHGDAALRGADYARASAAAARRYKMRAA